jgi:hypothetical protein
VIRETPIPLAAAGLMAAAGLLAVTLAWELGAFASEEPIAVHHPRAVAAAPPAALPDHTDEWVTTVLARPLFSPDRRPPSEAATVAAGSQTPEGLPRLTGVIVSPSGRSAIFANEGGKPVVVTEGGRVNAWIVRAIDIGTVRVSGPGGARDLHPSFEAAPATQTGATPPRQRIGLSLAR